VVLSAATSWQPGRQRGAGRWTCLDRL